MYETYGKYVPVKLFEPAGLYFSLVEGGLEKKIANISLSKEIALAQKNSEERVLGADEYWMLIDLQKQFVLVPGQEEHALYEKLKKTMDFTFEQRTVCAKKHVSIRSPANSKFLIDGDIMRNPKLSYEHHLFNPGERLFVVFGIREMRIPVVDEDGAKFYEYVPVENEDFAIVNPLGLNVKIFG